MREREKKQQTDYSRTCVIWHLKICVLFIKSIEEQSQRVEYLSACVCACVMLVSVLVSAQRRSLTIFSPFWKGKATTARANSKVIPHWRRTPVSSVLNAVDDAHQLSLLYPFSSYYYHYTFTLVFCMVLCVCVCVEHII
jgi:hypothetical protein